MYKKIRHILPSSFTEQVKKISEEVSNMTSDELIDIMKQFSSRKISIKPVTHNTYLVIDEESKAVIREYLAPSMFLRYRWCARLLAIEVMYIREHGGRLLKKENMRSIVRGLLVHDLYYSKYSYGSVEKEVVSNNEKIYGIVDELVEEYDVMKIYELKSSFNPDIFAASLQVTAYMLAVSEMYPNMEVEGYIITPRATYKVLPDKRVFNEYRKRLSRILEIALNKDISHLPPRLSLKLQRRCELCPYAGECKTLPDNYHSYEKFFEEQGFNYLGQRRNHVLF